MAGSLGGVLAINNKKATQEQKVNILESKILDARRRVVVLNWGKWNYMLLLTQQGDMLVDKIEDSEISSEENTSNAQKNPVEQKDGENIFSSVEKTGKNFANILKTSKMMPAMQGDKSLAKIEKKPKKIQRKSTKKIT